MEEFKGTRGEWKQEHRVVDDNGNYSTQVFSGKTIICSLHWAGHTKNGITKIKKK